MDFMKWLLGVLTLAQALWLLSWIVGRWTQRQEISNAELHKRLSALELKTSADILDNSIKAAHTRMDAAGREMSNFATELQGLETRFRLIFTARELSNEWRLQEQADRGHIWKAIEELQRTRAGDKN